MPPLAGIVNLREDPTVDLRIAENLGSLAGIGLYKRKQGIAQEELIKALSQVEKEGLTGDAMMERISQVRNATDTRLYQDIQRAYTLQKIRKMYQSQQQIPEGLEVSGGRYNEYGEFVPSYSRPRTEQGNLLEKQLAYWQQVRNRALDPFGEVLQGSEKEYELATRKIGELHRQMTTSAPEQTTGAEGVLPVQSTEMASQMGETGLTSEQSAGLDLFGGGPPVPEGLELQRETPTAPLWARAAGSLPNLPNIGKGVQALYKKAKGKQVSSPEQPPMRIDGQTSQEYAQNLTQLEGRGDPTRTPGTSEFNQYIESLPKEKRVLDRETAQKMYDMLKAQNPGLSKEQLVKLAEETAIKYGWILE